MSGSLWRNVSSFQVPEHRHGWRWAFCLFEEELAGSGRSCFLIKKWRRALLAIWWTLWRSDLSGLLAYTLLFGQDSMMEFAQWIDDFAPADPATQPQMFVVTTSLSYLLWFHVVPTKKPGWTLRQNYATSMDVPVLVRPWMLSYRKDFGVSSMIEPDVGSTLLSLFLTEGLVPEFVASISRQNSIQLKMDAWPEPGIRFMSNPDLVGTEKLNLTKVPEAYLEVEYHELPATIGGGRFLTLMSCSCSTILFHVLVQ